MQKKEEKKLRKIWPVSKINLIFFVAFFCLDSLGPKFKRSIQQQQHY